MGNSGFLLSRGNEILLLVRIKPNASQNKITRIHPTTGRLELRINAKPQDGEANEEVIGFFSSLLSIPKSRLALIKGGTSREKDILLTSASFDVVSEKIQKALSDLEPTKQ